MTASELIEDQAARWIVRREDPDWSSCDQLELDAWLALSMAHKAAYWRLEYGWRQADRIASLGAARMQNGNGHTRNRRVWYSLAAAAAVVASVAATTQLIDWSTAPVISGKYATAVGTRRIVPLTDGSKVELNTASEMRTIISKRQREVWLDRGEAFFEVAHLEGRPFVVHAGSRTVTVLGTKFAVRRDADKVTVSVLEGRVRVDDAVHPEAVPAAIITAGDVAVARGPATLLAAKSEDRVLSGLAWRTGTLNFDRTSLTDAAAEFNRYNSRQIVIGDADTGAIRIGGTFQTSNVDAFVRLLRDAYGLHVQTNGNTVKISS